MRRAPTQPPRPLDRLVGREADLAALDAELSRSRLVSIQGPPGVGKTRLAAELAVRCVLRGQKVAHCDVTECATAHDVTVRVATALGVATATEVAEHLAARPILLVIDNAEHVANELVQVVEPWLLAAPELRIVATTRIRLRVVGEVVFDLAPLDDNSAAELFVERARAVRREVGGDDRPTILELVRKLEGMPLAIELAAARSRLYEPAQLLAKLDRSAELLGGRPSRQRSLAAALELSFNLLGPLEMRALMQASVFRGGFTVEAAEAVIDLGGALVVEALEALVDHSLLWTRRVGTRRRLGLYMVVRDFAAGRLPAAEREGAQARHAAYFLRAGAGWLADIIGPNGPTAIATIAAEAENLLAVHRAALAEGRGSDALDAALVLDPLFVTRGPIDHGLEILDQALAAAPADHPRRLHALEVRANAMRYMHLETARSAYEELERDARGVDKKALARAIAGKGIVKLLLKDQTGESDVTRALVMQRELGDKLGALIAHASLGHLELHRNDLAVAREHFSRALALAVELRDPRNEGLQQGNLGLVEQECGRLDVARGAFERSLEVFRSLHDRRSEAWTLANLARVVQEQEQLDEARMLYTEALQRHEEVGNRRAVGVVHAHLAQVEQWEGNLERARELYQQALVALDISGSSGHHALVTGCIATVLADLGLTDAARHAFERAESAFGIALDETTLAALSVGRGHLELALGNIEAARRRHAEGSANIDRWTVRFARMGLERALARKGNALTKPRAPDHALVIGTGGRWFRAPVGAKVDLSRRRQLRLILAALATERRERPGHALTVEALFQQGWPGEVALPEAGASRVYVAISTLRRMGLRDSLHRVDVGYLIDPEASVHVEAESA